MPVQGRTRGPVGHVHLAVNLLMPRVVYRARVRVD